MDVNSIDSTGVVSYHYEHIPKTKGNHKRAKADKLHIVEAINWTYANGDKSICHFNRYFALDFLDGLTIATTLAIQSIEVAEEVVCIREATDEEEAYYVEGVIPYKEDK